MKSIATDGRHRLSDGMVHVWALRLFSEAVNDLGGDPDRLLKSVHIDPAALLQADAVVSYRSMICLLERAAVELKCPDFGLKLASRQGGIAVLGPLEIAMRNCSTLGEAYHYCAGHTHVYSPAIHVQIRRDASTGRYLMQFEILLDRVPNQRHVIENSLGLTHHAVLALSGGQFGAREVWFTHERPVSQPVYQRFFNCPVQFGKPFNAVFFNAGDFDQPIAGQNPQVYQMASSYIDTRFPPSPLNLATSVHAMATRLLAEGRCTHLEVAAKLGMHPRTLQRRLRDEGTCFDTIKDTVRRDAAARYLSESDIPLTRVASLLGYSESSVLARSCQRWFASSPRQLREKSAANVPILTNS